MAERADTPSSSMRDLAGKLFGGDVVSRERAREVLDDLVRRDKLTQQEAEAVFAELGRPGGTVQRLGDRAGDVISVLADHLGLVRGQQFAELELRVAQLEHRLRLLEQGGTASQDDT